MKKTNIIIILGGLIAAFGLSDALKANEYPRASIAEVPNGVASTFVGAWSTHHPASAGHSSVGPATCENPVRIESHDEASIIYKPVIGEQVDFALSAFMDRTVWMPELGESTLAVWTTEDEFFAYQVDIRTGKAKWETPLVYRRCGTE